jgi:hypothetical protein
MTISSRICDTTRRAQAGDAGTQCGPVTPSAATVQTSILRSSACCGLTGFRPASTSAFHCPKTKDKGDIAGYHYWAEFYAHKTGWIPVDISEAWKAKQKDYFFGSVDANRVQLSTGRDIALAPKQDGPALNYFVYPYVEVNGKPYDNLDKQFTFEEVKSSQ